MYYNIYLFVVLAFKSMWFITHSEHIASTYITMDYIYHSYNVL